MGLGTILFFDSICCGIFWKIHRKNRSLSVGIFVPKPGKWEYIYIVTNMTIIIDNEENIQPKGILMKNSK